MLHVELHFKSSPGGDGIVLIGKLGRQTGLATSALRYYERVGLLSPAGRSGGAHFARAPSVSRSSSLSVR